MKHFGGFTLDTSNECLWRDGEQIALQPRPFSVLSYLVENAGRLITHDEFLDKLWPETYVQPQVLRTYMLELRKLLGDDAREPRYIQSVPKRGYRFIAAVSEAAKVEPDAGRPRLAGRAEELAALADALKMADQGKRQVVFVTGDPGIGKTALVDAFSHAAGDATAGRGHCMRSQSHKEEFYPVLEALGEFCESAQGEEAREVMARLAPGWLTHRGRDSNAVHSVRNVGELCAALEEMAKRRTLLLVLDDLQWADEPTVDVISALARRRGPARLLVVATLHPDHPNTALPVRMLRQDLMRRGLCCELALQPLDEAAVQEMIAGELDQAQVAPEIGGFVHGRSGGNPLFVLGLLRHLMSQRSIVLRAKAAGPRWEPRVPLASLELAVPDVLAQMVEVEIAALSDQEQTLLEAASLFPLVFPVWGVAAALQLESEAAEEACDGLARRLSFLRRAGHDELPDGTLSAFYVFGHHLYREALYERQSPVRRAQRHALVAERLSTLFAGREGDVAREIALHYESAGRWRSAIQALESAAESALARRAHGVVSDLVQDAIRLAASLPQSERATVESALRRKFEVVNELSA